MSAKTFTLPLTRNALYSFLFSLVRNGKVGGSQTHNAQQLHPCVLCVSTMTIGVWSPLLFGERYSGAMMPLRSAVVIHWKINNQMFSIVAVFQFTQRVRFLMLRDTCALCVCVYAKAPSCRYALRRRHRNFKC